MEPGSLEKSKLRIQRSGKILSVACCIGMTALAVAAAFHVVVFALVMIDESVAEDVAVIYRENSFLQIVVEEEDEDGKDAETASADPEPPGDIPLKWQVAIGSAISALSCTAMLLYVRNIYKLMRYLSHGDKPFDINTARRMRKSSAFLLVLPFSNFLFGLIAFAISMLFSYMMEYGGYLQEKADQTNKIQEEIIESFAEITENKSGQTGQHIKRVSEYSRIIAEEMGLDAETCEKIRISSTMHDIGKLLIPSEILEKPGKLTEDEYTEIKKHTTYGGKLLENVEGDVMEFSKRIALQHHERFDGKGYPFCLEGGDTSLEGRIVAVADVYDALTSRRSYKEPWDEKRAYDEILKGRGSQFDPDVTDAFVRAYGKILDVKNRFADGSAPDNAT